MNRLINNNDQNYNLINNNDLGNRSDQFKIPNDLWIYSRVYGDLDILFNCLHLQFYRTQILSYDSYLVKHKTQSFLQQMVIDYPEFYVQHKMMIDAMIYNLIQNKNQDIRYQTVVIIQQIIRNRTIENGSKIFDLMVYCLKDESYKIKKLVLEVLYENVYLLCSEIKNFMIELVIGKLRENSEIKGLGLRLLSRLLFDIQVDRNNDKSKSNSNINGSRSNSRSGSRSNSRSGSKQKQKSVQKYSRNKNNIVKENDLSIIERVEMIMRFVKQ